MNVFGYYYYVLSLVSGCDFKQKHVVAVVIGAFHALSAYVAKLKETNENKQKTQKEHNEIQKSHYVGIFGFLVCKKTVFNDYFPFLFFVFFHFDIIPTKSNLL